MRRFPSLRNGKYIAQGAHAALGASDLSSREDISEWAKSGNTKIVLYVEDDQSLYDLRDKCREADLVAYLTIDAGRTEFHGPTVTALGIGPHDSKVIDSITKHLPLF